MHGFRLVGCPDYLIEKPLDLVNGAAHVTAAQGGNHPFDLPPVAKARDVAVAARPPSAFGGLEFRRLSVAVDQLRRVGESQPAMDERRVHPAYLADSCFATADECRQRAGYHDSGAIGVALAWPGPWQNQRPAPAVVSSP